MTKLNKNNQNRKKNQDNFIIKAVRDIIGITQTRRHNVDFREERNFKLLWDAFDKMAEIPQGIDPDASTTKLSYFCDPRLNPFISPDEHDINPQNYILEQIDQEVGELTPTIIQKYILKSPEELRSQAQKRSSTGTFLPVELFHNQEIAVVRYLGRGRGKGYRYSRAKSVEFDCLKHLLSLEIDRGTFNISERGELQSLRQLLREIRDKEKDLGKSEKGRLINNYGICADNTQGLWVGRVHPSIFKVFENTPWGEGRHVRPLKELRRARLEDWLRFEGIPTPENRDCIFIPWSTLSIDLLPQGVKSEK